MSKLISEQLPSDGSFQPKQLLDQVNDYLKDNGKHGKTAKVKVVGANLAVQFSFNGKQVNKGINERFTVEGLSKAKAIAVLISSKLELGTYSHEWLDEQLGKKPKQDAVEKEKEKTCKDLLIEYKNWWLKEKSSFKKDPKEAWYDRQRWLDRLESIETSINDKLIQEIILSSKANSISRVQCLQAIKSFLDFHCLEHPKFINKLQKENKPKSTKKYIPTDLEIEYYLNVLKQHETTDKGKAKPRKMVVESRQKMTFIYKILAIYGLRIHEVFQIANWDSPVTLKNGDWITVGIDENDESGEKDVLKQYKGNDFVIPAITDENNKDKILAVKHNTKTGYRMAMPLNPVGKNWIKEWQLIEEKSIDELLPIWKFEGKVKTTAVCKYFRLGKIGDNNSQYSLEDRFIPFTPHALRHAYNHRGHSQGINPSQLAQSLGHSLQMNSSTYLKTMREETKLEGLKNAFSKELNKVDEVEQLKAENKALRLEVERLREENRLLKTEKMLAAELKNK